MDRLVAMRQFVTVVEAGSFSAAAARLGMGQPAVSKAIANLEEHLGVRLLARTTRAHSLTDAGRRYYERARVVLDEADEADAAARDAARSLAGRLRVAAGPTYAALHVMPRLGEFLDVHPELTLDMVLEDRRVDLVEEGIDLAIRLGRPADSSLVARKLGESRRMLVASAGYLDRHGAPEEPRTLSGHRLIDYSRFDGPEAWTFRRGGEAVAVAVEPALRVSAAEGMRGAVLAGLGIGMASKLMFAPELARGAVRQVLAGWDLPAVEVWAVLPPGRQAPRRARVFLEWLESVLGPDGLALSA